MMARNDIYRQKNKSNPLPVTTYKIELKHIKDLGIYKPWNYETISKIIKLIIQENDEDNEFFLK